MKRWKKIPKPCLAHILWKVALIFVPVTFFILGTLQAWGLISFHSPRLNSALLGCLGQVCKCGESCCTCWRAQTINKHNPSALQASAGSQEWFRELPCAKALAFLTAHFQMYTKSEKLPSLRHFIKEMCETEYTPHTNVWTTWKHCGHPPTLTTCEASFQRCARCLYVTPQSGTR